MEVEAFLVALNEGWVENLPSSLCLSKEIYMACLQKFRWEIIISQALMRGYVSPENLALRVVCKAIHRYCGKLAGQKSGRTPLIAACRLHHNSFARQLLTLPSYKSSINATTDFGITALHATCLEVRRIAPLELLNDLLLHKADPNIQKSDGYTPLLSIVSGSCGCDEQTDVCLALLEGKANPNLQTDYGWTALHEAISDLNLGVAKALIEYKADISLKSNDGSTPLDMDPDRRIRFLYEESDTPPRQEPHIDRRWYATQSNRAATSSNEAYLQDFV